MSYAYNMDVYSLKEYRVTEEPPRRWDFKPLHSIAKGDQECDTSRGPDTPRTTACVAA